jgi:hypothetical protein
MMDARSTWSLQTSVDVDVDVCVGDCDDDDDDDDDDAVDGVIDGFVVDGDDNKSATMNSMGGGGCIFRFRSRATRIMFSSTSIPTDSCMTVP